MLLSAHRVRCQSPGSGVIKPVAQLPVVSANRRVSSTLRPNLHCSKHSLAPQPLFAARPASTQFKNKSRASTVTTASAADAATTKSEGGNALKTTLYVLGWYAFNIVFNLLNKSTLNIFSCPWFLATFQLVASGAFMALLWTLKLHPAPKVSKKLLVALLPVALFHTIGHVSACVSFSQMAVSFAHIVKAAEPVFSVALSGIILKETYPYYVWLSLLPIVGGCSLSALKELSFSWPGFNNAMISNLGMVMRNVYSKKSLNDFKDIDGINLFALLSIISIFYCAPLAVIMENKLWAGALKAATASAGSDLAFYQLLAAGGLFYHLYNQASYMVLAQGISPVTFSVGNTMKRVAVVVSSVLFFRNPVSAQNWVGSGIAILGTFLYSLAKQKAGDEKKKSTA